MAARLAPLDGLDVFKLATRITKLRYSGLHWPCSQNSGLSPINCRRAFWHARRSEPRQTEFDSAGPDSVRPSNLCFDRRNLEGKSLHIETAPASSASTHPASGAAIGRSGRGSATQTLTNPSHSTILCKQQNKLTVQDFYFPSAPQIFARFQRGVSTRTAQRNPPPWLAPARQASGRWPMRVFVYVP